LVSPRRLSCWGGKFGEAIQRTSLTWAKRRAKGSPKEKETVSLVLPSSPKTVRPVVVKARRYLVEVENSKGSSRVAAARAVIHSRPGRLRKPP